MMVAMKVVRSDWILCTHDNWQYTIKIDGVFYNYNYEYKLKKKKNSTREVKSFWNGLALNFKIFKFDYIFALVPLAGC